MHLFEFMDQNWLPGSLRATMRDILECGNSWPFRSYYDWTTTEIIRVAKELEANYVIELGAGTAPLTRHLLRNSDANHLKLIVCDSNPDFEAYRELESISHGRVEPIYTAVDFSKPCDWSEGSLLVLSGTLHHIPMQDRSTVVDVLRSNGCAVLVFEPLRRNLWSILFVGLSIVPALATPLRFLSRPGRLRRFVWCWAAPVAPLMFGWDGIISCLRMWTSNQWESELRRISANRGSETKQFVFSQMVLC